ncbi:MAG: hypothetical protein LBI12_01990 [Treponema sp.]|jgi:riboflavin kinase/FMN adenylyltransferase|nr:hypothetical protein [Treponema sp.]
MLEINWPEFFENGLPLDGKKTSMTVGVFDGVHRGHQTLLEQIVTHNASHVPVVISFRENYKSNNCGNIQSFRQKLEIFKNIGIKITVAVDFTESFRRIAGIEFLEILLKRGNIGFFAAGSKFRCGHKLDTGAEDIKNFFASHNIPVEIVPEILEGSLPISSSRIRSCITAGDHHLAQIMLGHTHKYDNMLQ